MRKSDKQQMVKLSYWFLSVNTRIWLEALRWIGSNYILLRIPLQQRVHNSLYVFTYAGGQGYKPTWTHKGRIFILFPYGNSHIMWETTVIIWDTLGEQTVRCSNTFDVLCLYLVYFLLYNGSCLKPGKGRRFIVNIWRV